jgi:hypothetical protein
MDLALHMGRPADALARELTEPEFTAWQHYAARRMLPQRRIELYLAQIALMVMRAGGNTRAKLADFLFDAQEPDDGNSEQDVAELFDFNPRNAGGAA